MMIAVSQFDIQFLGSYLWLSVILCLALLGASFLYYRTTTPPLPGWLKSVLFSLRIIAFIALFLTLTQPILTIVETYEKNKSIGIVIDRSNSMNLPNSTNSRSSRKEMADELLDSEGFSDLLSNLDFEYYALAESLDVTKNGLNLSGNKSDFGRAIRKIDKLTSLNPYDYILVMSDGRATTGESLADAALSIEAPIFTIAVGDSVKNNDIALGELLYNNVMYAGRKTEIKASISQHGDISGDRRIILREGTRLISQATISPPGDGKTFEATIQYTPIQPGRKILTLEVSHGEDANTDNNRKTFSVRVLKSKMNVLLYSSSVNQEYAFLYRYLKSREDYEVTTVIDAPGGARLGERFPNTPEKLNRFDAVVLIDPNLNRIKSHHEKFNSYLRERGGGLFILMGEEYAQSAANNRLEQLSPLAVSFRHTEFGKFHLTPNPRMIFHPAVKLGDNREEITAIWQNQPPFTSMVRVDSLRSNGVAMGFIEGNRSRSQVCGMALRRMGAGKVIAMAMTPMWNWAFYPLGVGGDASDYQEFVSGVIRWLTVGDESDRVNFKPTAEVFESGEEVSFEGFARDEGFRAIAGGTGEVVIVSASGDSTTANILPRVGKEAGYYAEFGVMPPGEYSYRADMSAENVRLGRFDGKFAVDDIDRETALTQVDWNYLKNASALSGGVFASYDNIQPVIDAIDITKSKVTETDEVRLWDHVILLIIILVALSAEWFIRKNRQLL
ncbi:MAG: VWA domain-containing protein [candidate division Zixibacteria bacterium]|nr:VWA domain-containing protein [candidate division Zixibacteria bacterium]